MKYQYLQKLKKVQKVRKIIYYKKIFYALVWERIDQNILLHFSTLKQLKQLTAVLKKSNQNNETRKKLMVLKLMILE